MRGALHVHSDYSHDGLDTLEAIHGWARASATGFVAMTEHAEDLDPGAWERYRAHCAAVSSEEARIIPGLEFRFPGHPGLHLLAMGLERWIEPASPAEFVRLASGAASFTVVAHPVLCHYVVPEEVRWGVNAVEIWNAQYNTRYLPDPRAIALFQEIGPQRADLVAVAGLDQHNSTNDRGVRVILPRSSRDPFATLRHGEFTNRGLTMRIRARPNWSRHRLAALRLVRSGLDAVSDWQERQARRARARSRDTAPPGARP